MPAPQTIDLLIHGSSEVVTPLGQAALTGAELGGVAVTRDGALAVDGGRILSFPKPSKNLRSRKVQYRIGQINDPNR